MYDVPATGNDDVINGSFEKHFWELGMMKTHHVLTLKGDVLTLKGDVLTLKGDVLTLKGDVLTLKGDVNLKPPGFKKKNDMNFPNPVGRCFFSDGPFVQGISYRFVASRKVT